MSVDYDLASQDVRLELLECLDHCHMLFLWSHVINLSIDEGLACITYGFRLHF